jgi:protease IV
MSATRQGGGLRRLLGTLWHLIDTARRFVLNLLFVVIVLALVVPLLFSHKLHLASNTTLVIDPAGSVVEQYTGGAREAAVAQALGEIHREAQLHDIVDAIDAAANDAKITRIALVLDDMDGAGLPQLREIAAALRRFRSNGKKVMAWGLGYDQRRYYLAAQADQIYLDPEGEVVLRGFGGLRNYYHDALERLGVTVSVFRAGKYKSFGEPFVANGPSPASNEEDAAWLNDAWATYTAEVERARKLPAGGIGRYIDDLPRRLSAAGGDGARVALDAQLIDGLKTKEEFRQAMIQGGAADTAHNTFRQVALDAYVSLQPEASVDQDHVAVVVAAGEIIDGEAPQGVIGARTLVDLIRNVRNDNHARALVLRVDSPGGSALGAELIRRELDLVRKAGKPVIVSMGNVAASGGFWISQSADLVLADPATISGSIGVIGILPSFDRTLDRLGIHTAGVSTTWLATVEDRRRPVDPRYAEMVQASIARVYHEFLDRVATARSVSPQQVDDVAQGRVWTGQQAKERGLIDALGGLQQALQTAAGRAKLGDRFDVVYVQQEPRGLERWLRMLPDAIGAAVQSRLAAALPAPLEQAPHDLAWIVAKPLGSIGVYAHCLCTAP